MRLDHDLPYWDVTTYDDAQGSCEGSFAATAVYTVRSDQILWDLYTRRSLDMRLPVPYKNFA